MGYNISISGMIMFQSKRNMREFIKFMKTEGDFCFIDYYYSDAYENSVEPSEWIIDEPYYFKSDDFDEHKFESHPKIIEQMVKFTSRGYIYVSDICDTWTVEWENHKITKSYTW